MTCVVGVWVDREGKERGGSSCCFKITCQTRCNKTKHQTQFHAASMDMTEEAMEQLRYGLSRSGPLQEALDHALKELDGCVFSCGRLLLVRISRR